MGLGGHERVGDAEHDEGPGAAQVLQESPVKGLGDDGFQVSVAMDALGSALKGDSHGLDRLLRRSPSLSPRPRGRIGLGLGARCVGPRLVAIMRACQRRRGPTKLGAVVELDGPVHFDTEGKAGALLQHWSQTFTGADMHGRGDSFAQGRVQLLAEGDWKVSRGRFEDATLVMRASALGLDGLSYSARNAGPPACHDALYCYVAWMSIAELPPDLNFALLALIPNEATMDLAPHETRPLLGQSGL